MPNPGLEKQLGDEKPLWAIDCSPIIRYRAGHACGSRAIYGFVGRRCRRRAKSAFYELTLLFRRARAGCPRDSLLVARAAPPAPRADDFAVPADGGRPL